MSFHTTSFLIVEVVVKVEPRSDRNTVFISGMMLGIRSVCVFDCRNNYNECFLQNDDEDDLASRGGLKTSQGWQQSMGYDTDGSSYYGRSECQTRVTLSL